jgi:2-methylcitrate dehydratase PrpD
MAAHADETDDAHGPTRNHFGAVTVPVALAVSERNNRSGREMLRAVVLGYDIGARTVLAIDAANMRAAHRSPEATGGSFAAAATAAALLRLDETQMRYVLSWAAQQSGGVYSWGRDVEHVEKAFNFCGQSARNGIQAADLVSMGGTGVLDVYDGEHNILNASSTRPKTDELLAHLGTRYYITETTIKRSPVGLPIQPALDALEELIRAHKITDREVEALVVSLPALGGRVVDDRNQPDINVQYVMAVTLVDGQLTFEASHSFERMRDPRVMAMRQRTRLVLDSTLPEEPRGARVQAKLQDGTTVTASVPYALGTKENPLDEAAIEAKTRRLMEPILGAERVTILIQKVRNLESVGSVRELIPLLSDRRTDYP